MKKLILLIASICVGVMVVVSAIRISNGLTPISVSFVLDTISTFDFSPDLLASYLDDAIKVSTDIKQAYLDLFAAFNANNYITENGTFTLAQVPEYAIKFIAAIDTLIKAPFNIIIGFFRNVIFSVTAIFSEVAEVFWRIYAILGFVQ